jgi:hypothetical protein
MTTTTDTADLRALVGPGQEDVFDQFLAEVNEQEAEIAAAEQGQADEGEDEQLLAGKFKSTEELEKAYLEAQKLISSRGQQPQQPADGGQFTPEQYTPDLGKQLYGDTVATAIEAAEINPLEMAQKVHAGEDVSAYVDALVGKGGLPRDLVETYLQGVKPAPAAASESSDTSLSDSDVAELKALVGGDQEFQQLSQWAIANLSAEDLADYNAAVDSGNKAAARFAIKQLQLRATSQRQAGEPELIGGGKPVMADVFESDQQAIEAMRKTNSKGQRLYNVDPKYRAWYEKTLQRSNVFQ